MTSTEDTPEIEPVSGKTRKPLTPEQREQKTCTIAKRRYACCGAE